MAVYWTAKDARESRPNSHRLLEAADEGLIDWKQLATDLVGWIDDRSVGEFIRANDLLPDTDDADDSDDSDN